MKKTSQILLVMNILSVLSLLALGARLKRVKEVATTINEKAAGTANVTTAQAWVDFASTQVVPLAGEYEGRRWGWLQDPPNVSMPKVYFYVYREERKGWGAWHRVDRGEYIPERVIEAQYHLQASQVIEMGTVMVCMPPFDEDMEAVIFKSVSNHEVLGHAREGDQVVATGPPYKTADGTYLVPIFPSGAVVQTYFQVAGTASYEDDNSDTSYFDSESSSDGHGEDEAIDNGTVLVCEPPFDAVLEDAEIFGSLTEHDVIGHVAEGEQVVATGPPQNTTEGLFLVPIQPSGFVELSFFRVSGEISFSSSSSTSSSAATVVNHEAINLGTVLICVPPPDDELEDADVLASLTEHDVIGHVAAGDQVVATGPPHDIGAGIFLVPIDPSGAVELSYFQIAATAPTAHAHLEALEAAVQAQWAALGILYDRQLQKAITAGTRLVCVPPPEDEDRSADIFSGHEGDMVGNVAAGDHVVATGPPEAVTDSLVTVPIEPSGKVLLKYFHLAGGPQDPYVGTERWHVALKAGVNVRAAPDVSSERLGEKKHRTILHGRQEGEVGEPGWLELAGEPGFIMIGDGALLERVSEDEDQAKRETAAIRIQTIQRGILARQKVKEQAAALQAAVEAEELLAAAAATRIQTAQRARHVVKTAATTRIQSVQRGRIDRRAVKKLKEANQRSRLSKTRVAMAALKVEGETEAFQETAKNHRKDAESAEHNHADCKVCVGRQGAGCWRLKRDSEWWLDDAWECTPEKALEKASRDKEARQKGSRESVRESSRGSSRVGPPEKAFRVKSG